MSSCVPEEIIYSEILVRLPVKTLLLCKSVCKNWYAVISTSDFVNLHLQFTTHTRKPILMLQPLLLSHDNNRLCSIGYDSLESSVSEIVGWKIEIDHYPFKFKSRYFRLLVGSCYGLFCIEVMSSHIGKFICLWNPATREYKKLPPMIELDINQIFALGYDHKTDDYKLSAGVTGFLREDTVFQFYSLASNSWKLGPTVPYSINYTAQWHEVVVIGYHHWLAIAQRKFFVLSFDIIKESFKEIQLPKELLGKNLEDDPIIPGVLEGCLCILHRSNVNRVNINLEVWKMLEYGVHESWTRRYIISHESIIWDKCLSVVALWSFDNGKIVFMISGGLVLYDPENGSARELSEFWGFSMTAGNYIF